MSQKPQPHNKNNQSDALPAASSNSQKETPRSSSILHSHQVSTQDSLPTPYNRQVSIQEPRPIIHNRRVSIQEPLPIIHNRRVSIQEPLPIIYNRRVSIQEPLSIIHNRRISTQEPSLVTSRWANIQDASSIPNSRRVSSENTPAAISNQRVSSQDAPPVTYSRRFHTRDVPSIFQTYHFDVQNSPLMTPNPLTNIESATQSSSQTSSNGQWTRSWNPRSSIQRLIPPVRAKVDVPPSITHSPTISIKSMDSINWTSQESFRGSMDSGQFNPSTLDNNIQSIQPTISKEIHSGGFQNRGRHSHSQLPMGWRLLHGAKKISRQLSLALSLVGMMIIGLISLGQPWIHFQVPLRPPGHPNGSLTIPINTLLFVRCPDSSCLHEFDQNAYLLDFAWAFFLIASIASFCLCILLINIIFFTSSNLTVLDFSNVIISILAGTALRFSLRNQGTSIILGTLFYLMQAREFLQEGMTYKLGPSFYLAWIGVFLFLMTGFFSYLNYINFWSILALQAIWT